MLNKRLITIGATAAALLVLTGCTAAGDDGAKGEGDKNTTVEENGDGRIDAGESMAIPSTDVDLIEIVCNITESGELTAVNAQQLNGFGMYMSMFATNPDSINAASGVTTAEEAKALADKYIPYGENVYNLTMEDNIEIPADLQGGLDAVCAGDILAIS